MTSKFISKKSIILCLVLLLAITGCSNNLGPSTIADGSISDISSTTSQVDNLDNDKQVITEFYDSLLSIYSDMESGSASVNETIDKNIEPVVTFMAFTPGDAELYGSYVTNVQTGFYANQLVYYFIDHRELMDYDFLEAERTYLLSNYTKAILNIDLPFEYDGQTKFKLTGETELTDDTFNDILNRAKTLADIQISSGADIIFKDNMGYNTFTTDDWLPCSSESKNVSVQPYVSFITPDIGKNIFKFTLVFKVNNLDSDITSATVGTVPFSSIYISNEDRTFTELMEGPGVKIADVWIYNSSSSEGTRQKFLDAKEYILNATTLTVQLNEINIEIGEAATQQIKRYLALFEYAMSDNL